MLLLSGACAGAGEDAQSVGRTAWCAKCGGRQPGQPYFSVLYTFCSVFFFIYSHYDSRFKGNSGWGYRVGIGYGYGDNSSWIDQKISGVGVPLELNYLLGEKKSKLEVGFGASLGMYHIKETSWFYSQPVPPETEGIAERYESKENRFGYFLFGNIGYRYQRTNGFMFRVGLSPSFNFGDKHGLSKSAFYPYIGLGWSF